jgi:hypothetical protein
MAASHKGLVLQMSLDENQAHPAKESPRSVFLDFPVYLAGSVGEKCTDRIFKLLPHKGVTSGATRNREPAIPEFCAVRESDVLIMQLIFSEQPVRKNMFVVERRILWPYSTNEATVAPDDVGHESIKAEKYDLTVGIFDRAVSSPHIGTPFFQIWFI